MPSPRDAELLDWFGEQIADAWGQVDRDLAQLVDRVGHEIAAGIVGGVRRRVALVPRQPPNWKQHPDWQTVFREFGAPKPGENAEAYTARITRTR